MLRGAISQLLLPGLKGKLIPVHEVLINTHAISNLIREGRTEQLQNTIFTSKDEKMVDLDQELQWLVKENYFPPTSRAFTPIIRNSFNSIITFTENDPIDHFSVKQRFIILPRQTIRSLP